MQLGDVLKSAPKGNGKTTAQQDTDVVGHVMTLIAAAAPIWPGPMTSPTVFAALHQDDDAHDTCTLTACLNPLHPGPCKGWKHSLFQTAPNAWHALEAARVEKANKNRIAKIEALKAAGKPIPKKLLTPIVAKPHPHPGQTAKAVSGEAHAAGQAVTKAAGVNVNAPGKVMLGQATKTLGQAAEKGPKGKKPTLASKGIAFVIAQEKVTPQYKLDKAAAITPEQWDGLSQHDKAVIRGELAKIKVDGFGPQQKKADELLKKLPAEKLQVTKLDQPKLEAPKPELKPGTPGTITAPSGKVYQKINPPKPEAEVPSAPKATKLSEIATPSTAVTSGGKGVAYTATHNGHTVTKTSNKPYTHASVVKWSDGTESIASFHMSEAAAQKGVLTAQQKANGAHVVSVVPVVPKEKPSELKPGAPGTITAPSGKVYQKLEPSAPAKIENAAEKTPELPKHVQHAIDMAKGTAPGASWSKNHLAAYQELKPEEFKALDTDVQSKILGELEKGKTKFLDQKKVKASQDLIDKFKSAAPPKIEHAPEPPKPTTEIKPQDMTPAQINTHAEKLLGPAAMKVNPKPTFSEFQANLSEGKKLAAAEVAKYGPEVVNDPNLQVKTKALESAFAKDLNAKTAQSKLLAHVTEHHMAAKTNPATGEPLTKDELTVIGKHATGLLSTTGVGGQAKQAHDDLQQAKEEFAAAANAAKMAKEQAPVAAPKAHLTEFDQKALPYVYSYAWGKHADKALNFGVKYEHHSKMNANPEYAPLLKDLGNLKILAGQVALAHAEANAAKLNAPLHPDTGAIEPGTPEAKAYAAALTKRSQLEGEFDALHKQAQARLDKVRTDLGLKKRSLPKIDAPAVKATAAESGYYKSASYSGPNYGKHASAKNYMVAKLGDKLGVAHKTASEKADEKSKAQIAKMADEVAKTGGTVSPSGKYVPPPTSQPTKDKFPSADEAGTSPSMESAQKYGFHYEQNYVPPVHDWPGDSGGAYVTSNPEHLEAARKVLSNPELQKGIEAQKQFQWSINNMESKGSPAGAKGSLYSYTGSGYDTVNTKLNSLPPGAKKTGSTSISNIDKGMEASPAPEKDLILYRGFKSPHQVFTSGKWNDVNVAGMEWSQRSYSSTSGNLHTAQSFAGYGGVVMRVIVPKEMQVKGINAKGGQHPGEAEVILQRGLRYRVVADHGKHGNTRYIDVMVVPSPYEAK